MSHLTTAWKKAGLIIAPAGTPEMLTHAMVPTADHVRNDIYRVYFSGRDAHNRSHVGFAEIDLNDPSRVLRYSSRPALGLGALGCFDDNGVTPSWIVDADGRKYLYYIGWNRGATVRMHLVAGLAVSDDGGESFTRVWPVPVIDRTPLEPLTILTAPCVLRENGIWRMWYVSGVEWVSADLPRYNIKYAESDDGLHWRRTGHVCIDFASPEEVALARPCVIRESGRYRMWFSYKLRDSNYRMGYAESTDGLTWRRIERANVIDVSSSGWDSEMVEYAFVFAHAGRKFMLYNGNNYGVDGIGLAVEDN